MHLDVLLQVIKKVCTRVEISYKAIAVGDGCIIARDPSCQQEAHLVLCQFVPTLRLAVLPH